VLSDFSAAARADPCGALTQSEHHSGSVPSNFLSWLRVG